MNFKKAQLQQILHHLPDTALIVFGEDLNILRVMDRDHILSENIPGIEVNQKLDEIDEHRWAGPILEICRNALNGLVEHRHILGQSGQMKVHAMSLIDQKGILTGILMVQGNQSIMNEYREELEREKEEAEETSEIKSRFMARISHEIRTPLNAIIGFIEQLGKTKLDKTQENYLKIIDKSSVYLLDLVNEILTFSKIESGEQQLDLVDFKLESLFNELYSTYNNRAAEKKINFRYTFDSNLRLIFKGDAFRLKQVVINLISNAIKFTEYGYVELKVERIAEESDMVWVRISVSDTGSGIPEHKIQDIFKEYKQASAGIARKHGGTGLGLTISKRLTELMKGKIKVTSVEGRGSLFSVEIPLAKSKLTFLTKETLKINTEVLSGKSVLIVDDDAMNRMLGEIILEGFNMEVSMASDGREAIDLLAERKFDILLLDIHMPVVSGLDVARFIRKELNDQNVKILAVTADMIREELNQYLDQGIDDLIIKPYREINMFNKLCQVLNVDSDLIQHETIRIVLKEEQESTLYDLSELRSITRDNEAFFNEMIQTFIENAENGIEQIKTAYKAGEWDEVRESAHRLTPSFKHLSIKSAVSDLIELKQRSTDEPGGEEVSRLIAKIEIETAEVIEQLKNEIDHTL